MEELHAPVLEYNKKTHISLLQRNYMYKRCEFSIYERQDNYVRSTVNNAVEKYKKFTGIRTSILGLTYQSGSLHSNVSQLLN